MVKQTFSKKSDLPVAFLPKESEVIYNLKIDRDSQKFFIDDEELAYGEFDEFTFRVLDTFSKMIAYNKEFEVDNETKLFKFSADAEDAKGTIACGRLLGKSIPLSWDAEQVAANKAKANWYTMLFGIITPKSLTKEDGTKLELNLNPVLCDFRVSGSTQKDVNDIVNKIKEEKKEYHKAELKFRAESNEEFDWPKIEVQADFSRELPVSGLEPFFDTINAYVDDHNNKIEIKAAKFKKYGGKKFKKRY